MTDNRTKSQRSYNMSRIRSGNTSPEMQVRKFLYAKGIRYRLHVRTLQGRPDIVINKRKIVIFVNGCFWHRHKNCKRAKTPKSNTEFWQEKFRLNVQRDKKNYLLLKHEGWYVIMIWECQLSNDRKEKTLSKLLERLNMEY